jgi:aminomethyltransferase
MLKRTPFYDIHRQAGAKLVDFGGWEMPMQYTSIKQEHEAVRSNAGLFDVSHMGELFVSGAEALHLIQHISVNDASKLAVGQAQYTVMCYEDGGIVDDLIVYKLDERMYMLVVNAANIEKDLHWIEQHNPFDAHVEDGSDIDALLAVQGPNALQILQKMTDTNLSAIPSYSFEIGMLGRFDGIMFSATGYTGEKGMEICFNKNLVSPQKMWDIIMEAGKASGIRPCGLGARDTLRLEMGYALYGNDITNETNPLEARLGWLVKLDKQEFIGKEALQKVKKEGAKRKLAAFTLQDKRAIPRPGYAIIDEQEHEIGRVTSGTRSISLNKNIGMGYVPVEKAAEGSNINIRIRNKIAEAEIVQLPFLG